MSRRVGDVVRGGWTTGCLVALAMAACGSRFELVDPLEGDCRAPVWRWFDGDADGWGDAGAGALATCGPDEAAGRTALNGLDCDDADGAVTAASVCPAGLLVGGGTPAAVRQGDLEWVAWAVPSGGPSSAAAAQACAHWSAPPFPEGSLPRPEALVPPAALGLTADVSWWIDLSWVGAGGEGLDGSYTPGAVDTAAGTRGAGTWDGTWRTADGALPTTDPVPWCGGSPPDPSDALPGPQPQDPGDASAFDALLPHLRAVASLGGASGERVDVAAALLQPAPSHLLCVRLAPGPSAWRGLGAR